MSYKELSEANEIINNSKDTEKCKNTLKVCIQALIHHQVLYSDSHTISTDMYNFIIEHNQFFKKYFYTAGFNFNINLKLSMIYLTYNSEGSEHFGSRLLRLKKDESLIRLVIKHIYNNGLKTGSMDENGRVNSSFEEIYNEYRKLTNTEPPKETHFKQNLLRQLVRRGCIKYPSDDDITILPGITIMVDDASINRLISATREQEASTNV